MPQIVDLTLTLPRHATKPYIKREMNVLEYVVWHHTAGSDNPQTPDFEPEIVPPEAIARFHINTNDWSGIGYHYLIYRDGQIYKVRSISTIGACVRGVNTKSVCIAYVGNYQQRTPEAIMLASGVWLTNLLLRSYPSIRSVRGHGEMPGQNTSCPGELLLNALSQSRSSEWWVV